MSDNRHSTKYKYHNEIIEVTNFWDEPNQNATDSIILAHGAGASAESLFMQNLKNYLSTQNLAVARFNFPYMLKTLEDGKRRPPNKQEQLMESFIEMIEKHPSSQLWIGGKSMGGRIATLIANHTKVKGVIVFGYPFHPVGKPDRLRIEHFSDWNKPLLIFQGERDRFGNRQEVESYGLNSNINIVWLTDGDHCFIPRKASGLTQADHLKLATEKVLKFIQSSH